MIVREWCETNSISIHAFNYWKHQLKEEVSQALPDIVPLSLAVSATPGPASTAVQSAALVQIPQQSFRANCANCAIHPMVRFSVNGTMIEIDPSVPENFLLNLIKAVRYA